MCSMILRVGFPRGGLVQQDDYRGCGTSELLQGVVQLSDGANPEANILSHYAFGCLKELAIPRLYRPISPPLGILHLPL